MAEFYFVPRWFVGFDIALEILFGIVTLGIALYALYLYQYSKERSLKLFGAGFFLISCAYFVWSLVNVFALSIIDQNVSALLLSKLTLLGNIGVYSYVGLFLAGLVMLVYVTFKVPKYRLFTLLLTLALLVMVFSEQKALAFHFMSSFLFFFLFVHATEEYFSGHKGKTLSIAVGFFFLFAGSLDFTLSTIHNVHYVVGHLLTLVGYIFMLVTFISAKTRHGQKTNTSRSH